MISETQDVFQASCLESRRFGLGFAVMVETKKKKAQINKTKQRELKADLAIPLEPFVHCHGEL